jgi:hypothetical protein
MRSKRPVLLTIIGLTTTTVVFWIVYEIYLVLTTKPASTVDPKLLEPISPVLDINTLNDLSERLFFEEGQETNAIIAPSKITPTQTLKQSPTPTLSPTPPSSPTPTGI